VWRVIPLWGRSCIACNMLGVPHFRYGCGMVWRACDWAGEHVGAACGHLHNCHGVGCGVRRTPIQGGVHAAWGFRVCALRPMACGVVSAACAWCAFRFGWAVLPDKSGYGVGVLRSGVCWNACYKERVMAVVWRIVNAV
jgi:hypothetical protein